MSLLNGDGTTCPCQAIMGPARTLKILSFPSHHSIACKSGSMSLINLFEANSTDGRFKNDYDEIFPNQIIYIVSL